jgi:N-acetylmuramic acid 6-phosphate etherase
MKAGTAQKMALNMISTVAMIRLGYVHGNRMTNVRASNEKLRDRAVRILMAETGIIDPDEAEKILSESNFSVRKAIEKLRCSA